jgi:hypothetical protein
MLHSQASHAHLDPSTTLQASPSHDLSTERCWKTLVKLIEALQVRVRLIGREWELGDPPDRLIQNTYCGFCLEK